MLEQTLHDSGYLFSQTDETIILNFLVDKGSLKRHLNIQIEPNYIVAGIQGKEPIIQGKFYGAIKKDSSHYKLKVKGNNLYTEYQYCEITLIKDVSNSKWPIIITGPISPNKEADAKSIFLLGQLTEGVLPDKTMELYQKSALKGHLYAQLRLGDIYEIGNSKMVANSQPDKAITWFEMASKQNCFRALLYCANYHYKTNKKLGLSYFLSIGYTKKQLIDATHVIKIQSDGIPILDSNAYEPEQIEELIIFVHVLHKLGKVYMEGELGYTEIEKSFLFWNKAASYNHPASCYEVAMLYKQGLGVNQDLKMARMWFEKANELDSTFKIPENMNELEKEKEMEKVNSKEDNIINKQIISNDKNNNKNLSTSWIVGLSTALVLGLAYIAYKNKQKS